MNGIMKNKIIKSFIGVAIGAIFLYLTLNNKPLDQIFNSLKEARVIWMLMSVLGLVMTFYLRAFRWKVLLESSDTNPIRYNVIHSLILGYFVNSFTPKFGEIIRCTSLKKSEKIPTSVSLGTVVSERIYDLLVLFLGLVAVFILEIDRLGNVLNSLINSLIQLFTKNALLGMSIITIMVIGIIALYYFSKRNKLAGRIKKFLSDLLTSLKMSLKMRKYKTFILLTVLIWLVLVFVYYSFLMSLPETNSYGLYFAIIVLFVGSVGWAIPSPSGIGTTNFMILQLFVAFSLNEQAGVSFGLLASGITFGVTVILGSLALMYHLIRQKRHAISGAR
jgi:uncharacterized protein (TIRG00374 family)